MLRAFGAYFLSHGGGKGNTRLDGGKGNKAPQAAGKIHSDFERGFIRAEVVPWQTLLECGNYTNAKERGKVRSEGKDYEIKDGDVVLFRFNV